MRGSRDIRRDGRAGPGSPARVPDTPGRGRGTRHTRRDNRAAPGTLDSPVALDNLDNPDNPVVPDVPRNLGVPDTPEQTRQRAVAPQEARLAAEEPRDHRGMDSLAVNQPTAAAR